MKEVEGRHPNDLETKVVLLLFCKRNGSMLLYQEIKVSNKEFVLKEVYLHTDVFRLHSKTRSS